MDKQTSMQLSLAVDQENKKENIEPILISSDQLSPETFNAVLESFISREGTDYGVNEISLEKKIENLRRKVERGEVLLVYDAVSESLTFLTQQEWKRLSSHLEKSE